MCEEHTLSESKRSKENKQRKEMEKGISFLCIIDQPDCCLDYPSPPSNDNHYSKSDSIEDFDQNYGVRLKGIRVDKVSPVTEKTTIYTLDINEDDFHKIFSEPPRKYLESKIKRLRSESNQFILVNLDEIPEGSSYYYPSFSNEKPSYISIRELTIATKYYDKLAGIEEATRLLKNTSVKNAPYHLGSIDLTDYGPFEFKAFGVGQGMCSLLYSDSKKVGILFDVGAGTPVKRPYYQDQQNKITNQLLDTISGLDEVILVLSHLDSDHYRLLHWDEVIRNKIQVVLLPSGQKWLDTKDPKFTPASYGTSNFEIYGDNFYLEVRRSNPPTRNKSKNHNCLVSYLALEDKCLLLPGDYTYKRMGKDRSPYIRSSIRYGFDFINVPHHGDKESGIRVPPAWKNNCEAFFSAGDHRRYKHPSQVSLEAHEEAGYNQIRHTSGANIRSVYKA